MPLIPFVVCPCSSASASSFLARAFLTVRLYRNSTLLSSGTPSRLASLVSLTPASSVPLPSPYIQLPVTSEPQRHNNEVRRTDGNEFIVFEEVLIDQLRAELANKAIRHEQQEEGTYREEDNDLEDHRSR